MLNKIQSRDPPNRKQQKQLLPTAQHFGIILAAFNNLVHACFGQDLGDNWEACQEDFFWLLQKYNIKLTIELRTLKYHVPKFINQHQHALGMYSEQASENIHKEWAKFFERYGSESKDNFQHRQLRALVQFNYLNL